MAVRQRQLVVGKTYLHKAGIIVETKGKPRWMAMAPGQRPVVFSHAPWEIRVLRVRVEVRSIMQPFPEYLLPEGRHTPSPGFAAMRERYVEGAQFWTRLTLLQELPPDMAYEGLDTGVADEG